MKRIGRRALVKGAGALTAVGLARPALAAGDSKTVLRFMPQVDLVFLDPHYSMTNITRNHGGMVFDQLYGTDGQWHAQPQVAEGPTVEKDGKPWRARLREALRFHDGEPVLARDCVPSIRRWA